MRAYNAAANSLRLRQATFVKTAVKSPSWSPRRRHAAPPAEGPAGAEVEPLGRCDQHLVESTTTTSSAHDLRDQEHLPRCPGPADLRATGSGGSLRRRTTRQLQRTLQVPAQPRPLVRHLAIPTRHHLAPDDPNHELQDVVLDWRPVRRCRVVRGRGRHQHRLQRRLAIDRRPTSGAPATHPAITYDNNQYYWRVRAVTRPASRRPGPRRNPTSTARGQCVRSPSSRGPGTRTCRLRCTSSGHAGPARVRVRAPGRHPGELHGGTFKSCRVAGTTYTPGMFTRQRNREPTTFRENEVCTRSPERSTTGECAALDRPFFQPRHPRRQDLLLRPGPSATPEQHHEHEAPQRRGGGRPHPVVDPDRGRADLLRRHQAGGRDRRRRGDHQRHVLHPEGHHPAARRPLHLDAHGHLDQGPRLAAVHPRVRDLRQPPLDRRRAADPLSPRPRPRRASHRPLP